MKAQFSLNPTVRRMLETSGYDADKVQSSVQSELNKGTLVGEASTLGNARLTSKGAEWANSEATKADYVGKTTSPIMFKAWHDAIAALFKKHGAPHAELTCDSLIPESVYVWLAGKMKAAAPAPAAAQDASSAPEAKANGQRNGKGAVQAVAAPQAPA